MRASIARLVDPAKVPRLPFSPSRVLNLAWGATTGLMLGLVLITAKERSDRRIKRPGDVAFHLNLAELGSIPVVKPVIFSTPLSAESGLLKVEGTMAPESVAMETWNRRSSPAAASYRAVLTSILFSQESDRTPQVIDVTIAARGEGKTTLVANLAAALAQMKQPVLVVDASGDRGLQTVFQQSQNYGLRDVLDMPGDNSDLLPYITHPTTIPGVSLVATGPSETSALDLLYSEGMGKLLDQMRRAYHVVLIDAPALAESPDARVFGRMADGVVLVIRAGETTLDAAQAAAVRLHEDGTILLGTVLNQIR
jgi:capsular exopolysaccharide synthesis family protein